MTHQVVTNRFHFLKKLFAPLAIICLTNAFASSPCSAQTNMAALRDFGDPNAKALWHQFAVLENKETASTLRIIQLGDSHTGGDYFTQALRENLQQKFGDAGPGWLTPGYAKNQRSAQVLFKANGQWKMRPSRSEPDNFPLGGFVNQAESNAQLEIAPKFPLDGLLRVSLWTRKASVAQTGSWKLNFPDGDVRDFPPAVSNDWQVNYVIGKGNNVASLVLQAEQNPPELGGIVIDKLSSGVSVDALGIVGATQKVVTRWMPEAIMAQLAWRQPALIILSYGTNEAFDTKFEPDVYRAELIESIKQIRAAAPNAAVLLIGAPSAAKKTGAGENVGCRYRLPPALRAVKSLQRQIAQEQKTLYWDWSAWMGGQCAIQRYAQANPPLARPDLVHFTEEGYAQSGQALFAALMQRYHDVIKGDKAK